MIPSPNILILLLIDFRIAPALINLPSVSKTSKWNPATGYDENDSQLYPYRAFGTGKRESLAVYLETRKPDLDYMCGGSLDGFRVTFNQPNEWPQVWKRYFQMSVGKAGMFLITPNYISTSPNLRDFDPNVRQCYFDGQRALHFFKYYTKHNCELECLANYTLSECECVRFSMPSKQKVSMTDDCTSTIWYIFNAFFLHQRNQRHENLRTQKTSLFNRRWKGFIYEWGGQCM